MRKGITIPLAGLLAMTIAGPALAGPNVTNASGEGLTIYAEWSAEGLHGYAYVGQETGVGGFGEIYQESGEWVACEPGEPLPEPIADDGVPTAQDTTPGEEPYGFVGTRTYGWISDIEILVERRLAGATAIGTVELQTETVDECAGLSELVSFEVGDVSLDATGVGPLSTFRGGGSYGIPSEFSGHQRYRGSERQIVGSVVAGGVIDATIDFGSLSQVSWTEHTNG